MIRLAKSEEITGILNLTQVCANHMITNGIFQWNKLYPSKKNFQNDMSKNELYVYILKEKLIGIITITPKIDSEYINVKWLSPNTKNLYVHRLAVYPKYQGKGYAQKLMDFAENFALENHFVSIRLDTFSLNKRNQAFYEKRGYTKLDSIFFPDQSKSPFYCYERLCKK